MSRFAVAIAFAVSMAGPAGANSISAGADAIELHLVKSERWSPVRCDRLEYALTDYVYCYPPQSKDLGVLYAVVARAGRPVIQPVTGKSKQFMPTASIQAIDGSSIAVEPWNGTQGAIDQLLQRARR